MQGDFTMSLLANLQSFIFLQALSAESLHDFSLMAASNVDAADEVVNSSVNLRWIVLPMPLQGRYSIQLDCIQL